MNGEVASLKVDRFDKFCFWAILIDILFLPYFTFISTSMSLPIIVGWFLIRGQRTHFCKEYKYFPIVLFFMIVATLISAVYTKSTLYETSFTTSIKRLLQYITSFWYFFFFRYCFAKYRPEIFKILYYGLVYIAILAVLYNLFRDQYMTIKMVLNPADNHTRRALANMVVYRYNFLWTDPNNVAYAVISMTIYIWAEAENCFKEKWISFGACIFILFSTMSSGGMLVGGISIILFWIFGNKISRKIKQKTLLKIVVSLFIIAASVVLLQKNIQELMNSDLVVKFLSRLNSYASSGDYSGGRLEDLTRSFGMLDPMFLLVGSGKEGFTTENGHIYLLAMYGLPVYIYFMYILFGKRKMALRKYILFLSLFVGFTMNIAIIEQKYLLITLLFAAYYSAQQTGNGISNTNN